MTSLRQRLTAYTARYLHRSEKILILIDLKLLIKVTTSSPSPRRSRVSNWEAAAVERAEIRGSTEELGLEVGLETFSILFIISTPGGNTEAKNFSIFDTPGSDSFNFGSHHDSLHDSQASLEWDPQGRRSLIIVQQFSLYYIIYIITESYITQPLGSSDMTQISLSRKLSHQDRHNRLEYWTRDMTWVNYTETMKNKNIFDGQKGYFTELPSKE